MPNAAVIGLASLGGYWLIAVILLLVVAEEIGVPMPFAPGDMLLVLAGAAVATVHLNPVVVAIAMYLAALSGAVIGRELFERVGSALVGKLPSAGRTRRAIERLGAALHNGGAKAVFVGRLTPGLRVLTTQVCGIVRLPRRSFVRGLVPALALYEAVFLGLGIGLGSAAFSFVSRYERLAPEILILVTGVTTALLLVRALWTNETRHAIRARLAAMI